MGKIIVEFFFDDGVIIFLIIIDNCEDGWGIKC